MNDDFTNIVAAGLGAEIVVPDPEQPGLSVTGYVAKVDVPARTVTINVSRRGGPKQISVKFPEIEQPQTGTVAVAPPEDEK